MLASNRNGTLYCGVTSDIPRRAWEHRSDVVPGFTREHGVHMLVWYELHATMYDAITREKAIKKWRRSWKLRLTEATNPAWRDLYLELAAS
jgi:putative endonuclease